MTKWYEYVLEVLQARGMAPTRAARHAGIATGTMTQWKKGLSPYASSAVQFARGMDADVLTALVATGLITAEEAGGTGPSIEEQLGRLSTDLLLAELGRRAGGK